MRNEEIKIVCYVDNIVLTAYAEIGLQREKGRDKGREKERERERKKKKEKKRKREEGKEIRG